MRTWTVLDLRGFAQPEWNRPDSVEKALALVAGATDEPSSRAAYNDLLFAVGNNHAGTYFPVLLAVLPALYPLLETGGEWTKRAILEALSDLVASFEPDPRFVSVILDGEIPRPLSVLVRASVRSARSAIERIAGSTSLAAAQAEDLLPVLGEADDSR